MDVLQGQGIATRDGKLSTSTSDGAPNCVVVAGCDGACQHPSFPVSLGAENIPVQRMTDIVMRLYTHHRAPSDDAENW